jgi:hypothetical protein
MPSPRFAIALLFTLSVSPLFAATYELLGTVTPATTAISAVPGSADSFYLADSNAGRYQCGSIRLLANRRSKLIANFTGYNGKSPSTLVTLRKTTYGLTTEGGRNNLGTIFRLRGHAIQTLVNFDSTTGAGESLHVRGTILYGTCANGAFTLSGRDFRFYPLPFASSGALFRGSLYATGGSYSELYQLLKGGTVTLQKDFSDLLLSGKDAIYTTNSYGGLYNQGSVNIFQPETNSTRTLVNFQTYNGGHPSSFVALNNGSLYSGNTSGVWRVSARPKLVRALENVRFLDTDGRRIFGVQIFGFLRYQAFVIRP